MRKAVFFLLAALVLACTSCGNTQRIYPVSGRVTYRGAPASGATVFFRRPGGDSVNDHLTMAVVREDGSFDVVCGSLGNGAPAGEYAVLVEWRQVIGQGRGRPQRGPDLLQGRYADPEHPLLHAVVRPRRNELPPFELTD